MGTRLTAEILELHCVIDIYSKCEIKIGSRFELNIALKFDLKSNLITILDRS